jgi:phytoene dehydrogenase-like protein
VSPSIGRRSTACLCFGGSHEARAHDSARRLRTLRRLGKLETRVSVRDYDVVVIGAGHNGLAATALLAKRGLRVVCLEKNAYPGGMAGTRDILSGCRNDVGASLLFPLAKGLAEELELARYGVELIDLPIMATNLASTDSPPAIFFSNPLRMASHVLGNFGPSAMLGFARLMAFCRYPASLMHRFTPRSVPRPLEDLLASAPSERRRRQIELAFTGSAMDLVDRFLPDAKRHRTLRALVAFAAVQSTYKGPYTPGSALCLIYTFAQNEGGGLMRRVRGGMGSLSEALCRSIAEKGGEVRLSTRVTRVIVEGRRAVGVELRGGERIVARTVVSNLDKPATFFGLVGREHLDDASIERIARIEHRGAYVHLLFKLRRLPRYGPPFAHLNADPRTRFNTTVVADPELQQASYEACRRGEVPEHPPIGMQIPTVMDPSLAPDGYHVATTYGFFFPCEAPREERGKLRDAMAEKILDRLSEFLPDLRDCIVERAVFSSDHFAAMQGATHGDFTHGLIHPEQMIGGRLLVPGSAHATPIAGLYLCGASCHPGPGVTFLPGYGAAYEVAEALGDARIADSASFGLGERASPACSRW